MFSFLRNIRRHSILTSAARKYLLYAIGEIALVVIGILIALQINNWNQNRLNKHKEYQLVKALKIELEQNEKYLDWRIGYLGNQVEQSGVSLLKSTGPHPGDMDLDSLASKILSIVYLPPYSPVVAKFRQIMSSDQSNLIQSDSLMQMLIMYEASLERSSWPQFEMRDEILTYLQSNFSPLFMLKSQSKNIFKNLLRENYSVNYFPIDGTKLLADPKFQGMVVTRLEANGYTIWLLSSLKRQVRALIDFIDHSYDF